MQSEKNEGDSLRILTVGHSDHALAYFLSLLKLCSVEVIADTRSYPYSNFAPQYDQKPLRKALRDVHIQYVHLG